MLFSELMLDKLCLAHHFIRIPKEMVPMKVTLVFLSLFTSLFALSCTARQEALPLLPEPLKKEILPYPAAEDKTLTSQMPGVAAPPLDTNIFVNLAKKIVPSVVNISTSKTVKSPLGQGSGDDIFRRFFEDLLGPGGGGPQYGDPHHRSRPPISPKNLPKAVSLGTGFIIDSSGLILTNNHVVADADEIKINFTEALDEKPTEGKVVGRDPSTLPSFG
jgi:S1-C subfamily serine protease